MSSLLAFAEQTSLPQLQLRDKKGHIQCSAFVNAFAVTSQQDEYIRPNGSGKQTVSAHGLWYISLLGAPGTGTTLQAIYAGAVENNTSHTLYLEGVGKVVLGNQRETLINQGYATHWNYHHQPFTVSRGALGENNPVRSMGGIHLVLEPRQVSVADPQRAALVEKRRRIKGAKGPRKLREEAIASTGNIDASDPEMRKQAGDLPWFLLLIPGDRQHDALFRQQLFGSFLAKRLPWPLKREWYEPLWIRCQAAHMIERLRVWSYGLPLPTSEQGTPQFSEGKLSLGHYPVQSDGFLCTPQPAFLAQVVHSLLTKDSEDLQAQLHAA